MKNKCVADYINMGSRCSAGYETGRFMIGWPCHKIGKTSLKTCWIQFIQQDELAGWYGSQCKTGEQLHWQLHGPKQIMEANHEGLASAMDYCAVTEEEININCI